MLQETCPAVVLVCSRTLLPQNCSTAYEKIMEIISAGTLQCYNSIHVQYLKITQASLPLINSCIIVQDKTASCELHSLSTKKITQSIQTVIISCLPWCVKLMWKIIDNYIYKWHGHVSISPVRLRNIWTMMQFLSFCLNTPPQVICQDVFQVQTLSLQFYSGFIKYKHQELPY